MRLSFQMAYDVMTNVLRAQIIFFIFCVNNVCLSQGHLWVKNLNSLGEVNVTSLCKDRNDNVYIVGSFSDTLAFDSDSSIGGIKNGNNLFWASLTSDGNLRWLKVSKYSKSGSLLKIGFSEIDSSVFMVGQMEDSLIMENSKLNSKKFGIYKARIDGNNGNLSDFSILMDSSVNGHFKIYKCEIRPNGDIAIAFNSPRILVQYDQNNIYRENNYSGKFLPNYDCITIYSKGFNTRKKFQRIAFMPGAGGLNLGVADLSFNTQGELSLIYNTYYSDSARICGKLFNFNSTSFKSFIVFFDKNYSLDTILVVSPRSNVVIGETIKYFADGKYILTGYYYDHIYIGSKRINNSSNTFYKGYFIGLFVNNDSAIWLKTAKLPIPLNGGISTGLNEARNLITSYDGDFIYSFFFSRSCDLIIEGDTLAKGTAFVLKVDRFGQIQWAMPYNSSISSGIRDFIVSTKDELFHVGIYRKDVYLDPYSLNSKATSNSKTNGFIGKIHKNTISRKYLKYGPYCAGDSLSIGYVLEGVFDSANYIYVEISDKSGEFNGNEQIIGYVKSSIDGSVPCQIPYDLSTSDKYKLRIFSTNPKIYNYYRFDTSTFSIYSKIKNDKLDSFLICPGDSVELTVNTGTMWVWSMNVGVSDSISSSVYVKPLRNEIYRVIVSDSSQCTNTDTIIIDVKLRERVNVELRSDKEVVCINSNINIYSEFKYGNSDKYKWNWFEVRNDTNWILVQSDSMMAFDTLNIDIPLEIEDSFRIALVILDYCSNAYDTSYKVFKISRDRSEMKLKIVDSVICYKDRIQIMMEYSAIDTVNHFFWQLESISLDSSNKILLNGISNRIDTIEFSIPSIVYDSMHILIRYRDICSPEVDSQRLLISLTDTKPMIVFDEFDTLVCPNSLFEIKARLSGGIASNSYIWTCNLYDKSGVEQIDSGFGSDSIKVVYRVPKVQNSSTMKFYFKIEDGCSPYPGFDSVIIGYFDEPQVVPEFYDSTVCFGDTIGLNVNGIGGRGFDHRFMWFIDTVQFDTAKKIRYCVNENTIIKVVLSDKCMGQSDTAILELKVFQPLNLNLKVGEMVLSDSTICYGQKLFIKANVNGGDSNTYLIKWYWNDSIINEGVYFDLNSHYFFDQGNILGNKLKVDAHDKCFINKSSKEYNLIIRNPLKAKLGFRDTLCFGNNLEIFGQGSGGNGNYKGMWLDSGYELLSDSINIRLLNNDNEYHGWKKYYFVISDECSMPSDTLAFKVFFLKKFSISLFAKDTCVRGGIDIYSRIEGGAENTRKVKWFVNDSFYNLSDSALKLFVDHSKLVKAVLDDGCSLVSDTAVLKIGFKPEYKFKVSPEIGCENLEVRISLKNNYSGRYSWAIDYGDGKRSDWLTGFDSVQFYDYPSSKYIVGFKAKTDFGCLDSGVSKLDVFERPHADFNWAPQVVTYDLSSIQFINESIGNENNKWVINNEFKSIEMNPTVILDSSKLLNVCLFITSRSGCVDSICKLIVKLPDYKVYFPSSFSPNGDSNNDVWKPFVSSAIGYSFKVYNRWGENIFEGNENTYWDGKYQGELVQEGFYMYTAEVKSFNGIRRYYRGVIQLIY